MAVSSKSSWLAETNFVPILVEKIEKFAMKNELVDDELPIGCGSWKLRRLFQYKGKVIQNHVVMRSKYMLRRKSTLNLTEMSWRNQLLSWSKNKVKFYLLIRISGELKFSSVDQEDLQRVSSNLMKPKYTLPSGNGKFQSISKNLLRGSFWGLPMIKGVIDFSRRCEVENWSLQFTFFMLFFSKCLKSELPAA